MSKYKHLSSIIAILCLISSCSLKEEQMEIDNPAVTLRASLISGTSTKASFGDFTSSDSYASLVWDKGDSLALFSTSNTSTKYVTAEGGSQAVFTPISGEAPSGSSFLGLSPYNASATSNISSKTLNTTIPVLQLAYPNTFDPTALLTVGSSTSADAMSFYNVCTGFRFTLSDSKISSYSSIELKGNNDEKISGSVTISKVGSTTPVASISSNGGTSVTLQLPEGSKFAKNTYYYILFAPTEFKNGFSLIFKDSTGASLIECKCSSYVQFKRAIFPTVKDADNPSRLAAIKDGDLLSENGTANCYIVSKAGSYKFPLVKGNEEELMSGVTKVDVLWETDNTDGSQTKGSIIKSVSTNGKYVYFDTPSTLKEGNAIIAGYSGSEIVWSWHIWVCNGYNPEATKQQYPGKASAMMDRNLGALSASRSSALSNGLFYQWGRKDPFPGAVEQYVSASNGGTYMTTTAGASPKVIKSDSSTGTIAYATANPSVFIAPTLTNGNWLNTPDYNLWLSDSKTVNDPCPAGWKVPDAYVLDSNKNHVTSKEAWKDVEFQSGYGYGIYYPSLSVWYPNNGYISKAGALLMVGQYSCYWSCSNNSQYVFALELSQSSSIISYDAQSYGKVRGEGHSVRCVAIK